MFENPVEQIISLNRKATQAYQRGEFAQGLQFARQACELGKWALGENNADYAALLNNLASLYEAMGRFSDAEPLYQQAKAILKAQLGENNADYATSLNNLASLYKVLGRYKESEPLYLQAQAIRKVQLGENNADYAISVDNLASLYKSMGRFSNAEPLYLQANAILKAQLGENHPDYAASLNNLASLYKSMGRYKESEPLYLQAQAIRKVQLGENHPDYAASLNNLAELYKSIGRYKESELLHLQAQAIRKVQLGENHPDYAASLNNLAELYKSIGRYKESELLHLQAQAIRKVQLEENHPDYAASLNNLAELYKSIGRYKESELLHLQATAILKAQLGENHPHYAQNLNNLASLYQEMGRLGEAEPLYLEATAILKAQLGENHPHYAQNLNNLASLYQEMGRLGEAEPLYLEASAILKAQLGENHPDYAASLNNLASLYQEMGKFSDAEPFYLQDITICKVQLEKNHPDYAVSLNNLAGLYYAMGRFSDAKPLYQQATTIFKAKLGENHPGYATSLNNLAGLYYAMGRFSDAEPLYQQAKDICKVQLGENHPHYAASLNNLAGLLVAMNRASEAFELMQEATAIQNRILGEILAISSDRQRLDYLQQNYYQLEQFLSLVLQHFTTPAAQRAAFDLVLRRKCLATEAAAFLRTAILSERYQHLAPQLEEFRQLAHAIAAVTMNVPSSPEGLAEYRIRLATLQQQQEQLERELSRQIPEMNLQSQLNRANRQAIALALPDNSVLLEFVQFRVANFKAVKANGDKQWLPPRYVAFVLKAGEPEQVTMVDLGDATEIDALCQKFREAVSRVVPHKNRQSQPPADWKSGATPTKSAFADSNNEYTEIKGNDYQSGDRRGLDFDWGDKTAVEPPITVLTTPEGKALYQRLIAPLKPYLQPQQVVYLAPDGELNLLPFGILAADESRYLLNEYELRYLSVGRDVLRFQTKISAETTAPLIIANPDYDLQLPQPEVAPEPVVSPPKPPKQPQPVGNDVVLAMGILLGVVILLVLLVAVPPVGGIVLVLAGAALAVKVHTASYPERLQTFEQEAQEYERVVTPPPPTPQPLIIPKPVTTAPVEELTRSSKNGFTPLPGTAIEGKQVAASLQVPVYTEAQAVKSLLSSCKSPRLVHIATHGYFLEVSLKTLPDFILNPSNIHRAAIENPLTRSGLAFAGANAGILGKNLHPEAEDGLMTAQGVSGLDFTGTQLVVLSACETGLGNVQTGESVGGLRRSLILAGAEAVVMSLWSVPDVPTAILMERFYHYLLSEKKGRTIALETAQADLRYLTVGEMRDRWLTDGAIAQVQQYSELGAYHLHDLCPKPNDYQPYSHPYYWSAFVCAGDASPMKVVEGRGNPAPTLSDVGCVNEV